MTKTKNPPAFPRTRTVNKSFDIREHVHDAPQDGMTLRDYFAAKAMQAIATNQQTADVNDTKLAAWAYSMADAMLAEREK